jgi:hypothetical protein
MEQKKSHLVTKQDEIFILYEIKNLKSLILILKIDYPKVTLLKPEISTLNPLT